MASLGAVIPFLGVLADPTPIYESSYAQPLIKLLGIDDPNDLALPITLIFIGLIITSAVVRLILLWVLTRLSFQAGADLSINIYRHTLYQDYSIHVSRNSSEVINGIITKTHTATKGVIAPILNLISSIVTILGIVAVLFFIDSTVTITAFLGFGGLYVLVMYMTRRHLSDNSKSIAENRISWLNHCRRALKEFARYS